MEGTNLPFSSPVELIDYYKKYGLPENDTGEVILLNLSCNNFSITEFQDSATATSYSRSNVSPENTFVHGHRPRFVNSSILVFSYNSAFVETQLIKS